MNVFGVTAINVAANYMTLGATGTTRVKGVAIVRLVNELGNYVLKKDADGKKIADILSGLVRKQLEFSTGDSKEKRKTNAETILGVTRAAVFASNAFKKYKKVARNGASESDVKFLEFFDKNTETKNGEIYWKTTDKQPELVRKLFKNNSMKTIKDVVAGQLTQFVENKQS